MMDNINMIEEEEEEKSEKIIHVLQGCYAFITPDTNSNVVGLLTTGLVVCTGLVVSTQKQPGYVFLAHLDAGTDLTHSDDGIRAWISKIPLNFGKITIKCDEQINIAEFSKHPEEKSVKKKLLLLFKNEIQQNRIEIVSIKNGTSSLAVDRQGKVDRKPSIQHANSADTVDDLSGMQNIRIEYSILRTYSGPLYIDNNTYQQNNKRQPICLFNGKKMFTQTELIHKYNFLGPLFHLKQMKELDRMRMEKEAQEWEEQTTDNSENSDSDSDGSLFKFEGNGMDDVMKALDKQEARRVTRKQDKSLNEEETEGEDANEENNDKKKLKIKILLKRIENHKNTHTKDDDDKDKPPPAGTGGNKEKKDDNDNQKSPGMFQKFEAMIDLLHLQDDSALETV